MIPEPHPPAATAVDLDGIEAWAAYLASVLPDGALLLLSGPLAAGKTTLVSALAAAHGSEARVSSPTYTLVHEYPSPVGLLVHVDAYRLPDARSLLGLGLEDYLERARWVAVEWGDGLAASFPDAWRLHLEPRDDGRRDLTWTPPAGADRGTA